MQCQDCQTQFYSCPAIEPDRFPDAGDCPLCGSENLTGLQEDYDIGLFKTGYQLSFGDFEGGLRSSGIQDFVAGCLDCKVKVSKNDKVFLSDRDGKYIPLLAAHLQIQMNPKWQYDIYQLAMNGMR